MGFFSTLAGLRALEKASTSLSSNNNLKTYSPTLATANPASLLAGTDDYQEFDETITFSSDLCNYTVPSMSGVREFSSILTETIVVYYTKAAGNVFTVVANASSSNVSITPVTVQHVDTITYWVFPTKTILYLPKKSKVNFYLIISFCVSGGVFCLLLLLQYFISFSFSDLFSGLSRCCCGGGGGGNSGRSETNTEASIESSPYSAPNRSPLDGTLTPEEIERQAMMEQAKENQANPPPPTVTTTAYPPPPTVTTAAYPSPYAMPDGNQPAAGSNPYQPPSDVKAAENNPYQPPSDEKPNESNPYNDLNNENDKWE